MKPIFLKPASDGHMLLAENTKQFKTEMMLNALALQTWEQYQQRIRWLAKIGRTGGVK